VLPQDLQHLVAFVGGMVGQPGFLDWRGVVGDKILLLSLCGCADA
jgi:hypothetical protein